MPKRERKRERSHLRPNAALQPIAHLTVIHHQRRVMIDTAEIDRIEAADYYVEIFVGAKSYLHRETMANLERSLDPALFVRVSRSVIVNRRRIQKLLRGRQDDLAIVLDGGKTCKVSRRKRAKIADSLVIVRFEAGPETNEDTAGCTPIDRVVASV